MANHTILMEFRQWIHDQSSKELPIIEDDKHNYSITAGNAMAEINIYELEMVIVEMRITEKEKGENIFFLHFELNDIAHAKELFTEMTEALKDTSRHKSIRILLSCTSGLTTSFFAEKLNETAQYLNFDYEFHAVSYTELFDSAYDYDIILIAPQISYLRNKISAVLSNKIIIDIPAKMFASYDAADVIYLVREALEKPKNQPAISEKEENNFFLPQYGDYGICLVIGVYNSEKNYALRWRIYNECEQLDEGAVRKRRFRLRDFEDLLDTVLTNHPEVQYVYISTPGIVNHGKLTFPFFDVIDVDVVSMYEKKYKRYFALCNDAKAITRGYYEDHKAEMNRFALYYAPMLTTSGGAGIVIDGKMYFGENGMAGEMPHISRILRLSDDRNDLAKTMEGQTEMTAKMLLILLTVVSPEVIGFYNPMVTDIDDVKAILKKYVRPSLLPKIVKITDDWENMIWGAILLGMEELHARGIITLQNEQ